MDHNVLFSRKGLRRHTTFSIHYLVAFQNLQRLNSERGDRASECRVAYIMGMLHCELMRLYHRCSH